MSTQAIETVVRRYYEEVLTKADWFTLEQIVATDFVDHERLFAIPPTRAGIQMKYDLLRTGFPDLRFVVEDIFAAADKVAARVTVQGTHRGTFLGRPATNQPFAVQSVNIMRVVANPVPQIVEHWGVFDQMSMLAQLGAVPGQG